MNEIEKLYENAGIKPNYIDACTVEDKYWQNEELANKYVTFDMYMNAKCGHQEDCTTLCSCAYTKEEYPPFTAEKQVELIKLLSKVTLADYFQFFFYEIKEEWVFRLFMITEMSCKSAYTYESRNKDFADALAGLINNLGQDLTEEEQKQIKEILQ